MSGRIDEARLVMKAAPARIWQALTDGEAVARWLPPEGMTGEVLAFEPREGGRFEIRLSYRKGGEGKTTADADVVRGRFGAMEPGRLVTWLTRFESDDPRFAGEMRMSWIIADAPGGAEVHVKAENVPEGISAEDHAEGMGASLRGLKAEVEAASA